MHLSGGWLANNLDMSLTKGGYLRLICLDVRFGWQEKTWDNFRSKAPANWMLVKKKLIGEDHESMVFTGFFEGLKEIFADYSSAYRQKMNPQELFEHYESLASTYGAQVTPPKSILQTAIDAFTVVGDASSARTALKLLSQGYGEPINAKKIEADIEEASKAMKGKESVQQIMNSKRPTESEMNPFLGNWEGTVTTGSNTLKHTLRFELQSGKISGQLVADFGNNETMTQEIEFIRLTKSGMEFGFMNGMQPKGVIVYAAHLDHGSLIGTIDMRGVYFKPPDGFVIPHQEFTFSRVKKVLMFGLKPTKPLLRLPQAVALDHLGSSHQAFAEYHHR